jgi:vacuolar-type H+-ATPase catalytic subunit A/Vma1
MTFKAFYDLVKQ